MKTKHSILFFCAFLTPLVLVAHGMDAPGPHKGAIQMPGPFHTEVTKIKEGKFRVYLLDMEFRNPRIKDSSVEAIVVGKTATKLDCQPDDYDLSFVCTGYPTSVKSGQLHIKAKRAGAIGNTAVYDLPLKIPKMKQTH